LNEDIAYVAVWNEAYERSALRYDPVWSHENYGEYFAGHMGHDLTLMIGADGQVIYASEQGKAVPAARLAGFTRAAAPLFEKVRAETGRQGEALDRARYRRAEAFVSHGGKAWLVAAGSVAPQKDWRGTLLTGPEPVVVSAIEMDAAFLGDLQADYDLEGLRLLAAGETARTGVVLNDVNGAPAPPAPPTMPRACSWPT
jgi:sensor domain CHASE-containing protein